ncbi:MAG: hypothetical protein AVDCRST_MAG33-2387, partial [uncultured Thermomicrobiales bacterium]
EPTHGRYPANRAPLSDAIGGGRGAAGDPAAAGPGGPGLLPEPGRRLAGLRRHARRPGQRAGTSDRAAGRRLQRWTVPDGLRQHPDQPDRCDRQRRGGGGGQWRPRALPGGDGVELRRAAGDVPGSGDVIGDPDRLGVPVHHRPVPDVRPDLYGRGSHPQLPGQRPGQPAALVERDRVGRHRGRPGGERQCDDHPSPAGPDRPGAGRPVQRRLQRPRQP